MAHCVLCCWATCAASICYFLIWKLLPNLVCGCLADMLPPPTTITTTAPSLPAPAPSLRRHSARPRAVTAVTAARPRAVTAVTAAAVTAAAGRSRLKGGWEVGGGEGSCGASHAHSMRAHSMHGMYAMCMAYACNMRYGAA